VVSAVGEKRDASKTTIANSENGDQYLSRHQQAKQYHPTPEQLKVRKARHRRSGSTGSGNCNQLQGCSPRISPLRDRRVGIICANIIMPSIFLF
jgi:hypothetical protein